MRQTEEHLWEAATPLGKVYITDEWFTCKGKYAPFAGGCGIGPGQDTFGQAKGIIVDYLKVRKASEISNLETRLKTLNNFNPENL